MPLGTLSGGFGKVSLLITLAPWAKPSATRKFLPRSISSPGCERQLPGTGKFGIGSASQLPWQAVPCRITHDGDWFTWGRPLFPASMPPACPMHKNSSPNAVSRGEGSFSPCLPGHEGPCSLPMGVQSLAPLHWSLPVASPLRENRDAPEAVKGRVQMPPFWGALG